MNKSDFLYDPYKRSPIAVIENGVLKSLSKPTTKKNIIRNSSSKLKSYSADIDEPEQTLKQFFLISKDIKNFISSYKYGDSEITNLILLNDKFITPAQNCLQTLLAKHLKIFFTYKVERLYWKHFCYDLINFLDNKIVIGEKDIKIIDFKHLMIKNIAIFYRDLFIILSDNYEAKLDELVCDYEQNQWESTFKYYQDCVADFGENQMKTNYQCLNDKQIVYYAIQSLYWMCIAFGDLTRYYVNLNLQEGKLPLVDLSISKSTKGIFGNSPSYWYNLATQINPSHITPYHQMSVLCSKAKLPFDTLYYFIRALGISDEKLVEDQNNRLLFEGKQKDNNEVVMRESIRYRMLTLFEENQKTYGLARSKKTDIYASIDDFRSIYSTYTGFNSKSRAELIDRMLLSLKTKTEFWVLPHWESGLKEIFSGNYTMVVMENQVSALPLVANMDATPDPVPDPYLILFLCSEGEKLAPYASFVNEVVVKMNQQQRPYSEKSDKLSVKYFILYFLNLHGKLYTRIDLDHFSTVLPRALLHFKILMDSLIVGGTNLPTKKIISTSDTDNNVSKNDIHLRCHVENVEFSNDFKNNFLANPYRLLQILAINLFSISRSSFDDQDYYTQTATLSSDTDSVSTNNNNMMGKFNEGARNALLIAFHVFAETLNTFFTLFSPDCLPYPTVSPPTPMMTIFKGLILFLPFFNVWIRYMLYNFYRWKEFAVPFNIRGNLLRLRTIVTALKERCNTNVTVSPPPSVEINRRFSNLFEFRYFIGFGPLRELFKSTMMTLEDEMKFVKINENNVLKLILNETNDRIYMILDSIEQLFLSDIFLSNHQQQMDDVKMQGFYHFNDGGGTLRKEEESLCNNNILGELYEKLKRVDDENSKKEEYTIMVIKPKFLVFDTNCVIDYLSDIERLLNDPLKRLDNDDGPAPASFTLMILIPNVVIGELEKLAKTSTTANTIAINNKEQRAGVSSEDVKSSPQREYRKSRAQAALNFFNQCFSTPKVTAAVSKIGGNNSLVLGDTLKIISPQGLLHNFVDFLNPGGESLNFSRIASEFCDTSTNRHHHVLNHQTADIKNLRSKNIGNERCSKGSSPHKNAMLPRSTSNHLKLTETVSKFSFKKGFSTLNDDLILQSCNKFMRRNKDFKLFDNFLLKDGGGKDHMTYDSNLLRILKRNLVFFTDDQNLKIKSHTMCIPTRNFKEYLQWWMGEI